MNWQCLECERELGTVVFTDKVQNLRFEYCPHCNRMSWQQARKGTDIDFSHVNHINLKFKLSDIPRVSEGEKYAKEKEPKPTLRSMFRGLNQWVRSVSKSSID